MKQLRVGRRLIDFSVTDFVGNFDGITFGVQDGKPFHTGSKDWSIESQVIWASANGLYLKSLSDRIFRYANIVAEVEKI